MTQLVKRLIEVDSSALELATAIICVSYGLPYSSTSAADLRNTLGLGNSEAIGRVPETAYSWPNAVALIEDHKGRRSIYLFDTDQEKLREGQALPKLQEEAAVKAVEKATDGTAPVPGQTPGHPVDATTGKPLDLTDEDRQRLAEHPIDKADPYNEGAEARRKGVSDLAQSDEGGNPYEYGTDERNQWLAGWNSVPQNEAGSLAQGRASGDVGTGTAIKGETAGADVTQAGATTHPADALVTDAVGGAGGTTTNGTSLAEGAVVGGPGGSYDERGGPAVLGNDPVSAENQTMGGSLPAASDDAHAIGFKAGIEGKTQDENPYDSVTDQYRRNEWARGHRDSQV